MKLKNKVLLFLALLICWTPMFMGAWDKDKPATSTSLRNSNPEILANWTALETAIGQDHEFSTGGTNSGEHTQIKFNVPISTPTNAANKGWLYSKDVSAVVEAHWLDESGNELQFTSGGNLFSSTGLTVTGTSTFNGSITLGAGDDLIGSSTSDITFNTDKFTVAGATGNTVVAGTLGVTGVLTTTAASVLGDGSTLAAATESGDGDRTISDKAYVDTLTDGDVYTANDSESNAMLHAHAYLAQTSGFVSAFSSGSSQTLKLYVGTTTDPEGAGTQISEAGGASVANPVSGFVPNGKYFEVTRSAAGAVTIVWAPLVSGGSAPVDQD